MLHIAFSTLKHHKKISIFYFVLLILVFVLLLTVLPLFSGLITTIDEAGKTKYGTYDLYLYDLSEEDIAAFKGAMPLTKFGRIENYGSWQLAGGLQGNSITLGYFDQTAWDLGYLQLAEGRMPEKDDEIVLTENSRFYLGRSYGIGEQVTLSQEGRERTFTVCGILNNYGAQWFSNSIAKTFIQTAGYNDFPKALVNRQEEAPVRTVNALCYSDGVGGDWMSYAHLGLNDDAGGSLYYSETLINQLRPIKMFRNLFLAVIIFGIVLCINTGLSLYIDTYRSTYQTMFDLGAETKHPFILFGMQQVILLFGAVLLAIPCSLLVVLIARALLHNTVSIDIFTSGNLLLAGVVFLLLCALTLYRFRSIYLLKGLSISQKKKRKMRQMRVSRRLSFSLTGSFLGTTFKKVLPILLLVALLFSCVSFSNVYMQDMLQMNAYKQLEAEGLRWPDFQLNFLSHFEIYETVTYYYGPQGYPKETIDRLYQYPGVEYVKEGNFNDASLLLPANGDPYWGYYDTTLYFLGTSGLNTTLSQAIPGVPQDVMRGGYGLYVLDEALLPALKDAYPELTDEIEGLGKDEILAFFPPLPESGRENTLIAPGDELTFATLNYDGDPLEALRYPNLLQYREHHLTLAAACDRPFEVYIHGRKETYPYPVFVVTKETVDTNDLYGNLTNLNIYLSPDISEEEYAAIEQYVIELTSTASNVILWNTREENEQDQQFRDITFTALAIMLTILGIFVILSLFVSLYMALLQRKHSLSILRSLGMSKGTLALAIFMELLVYVGCCIVLSLVFYFVLMYGYLQEQFAVYMTAANTMLMLRTIGLCLIAVLIICIAMVCILLHNLYKESIYSSMRTAE